MTARNGEMGFGACGERRLAFTIAVIMPSAKIFLKGGVGNNLFQLAQGVYLSDMGYDVSYNLALTRRNALTRLLGWSAHPDDARSVAFAGEALEDGLSSADLAFLLGEFAASRILRRPVPTLSALDGKSDVRIARYYAAGEFMTERVIRRMRRIIRDRLAAVEYYADAPRLPAIVHYRAGDMPPHKRLAFGFYRRSIEKIAHLHDEIHWITNDERSLASALGQSAGGVRHRAARSNTATEDFILLMRAGSIVCSNSTFCYWAAILGDSERLIFPEMARANVPMDLLMFDKAAELAACEFETETKTPSA